MEIKIMDFINKHFDREEDAAIFETYEIMDKKHYTITTFQDESEFFILGFKDKITGNRMEVKVEFTIKNNILEIRNSKYIMEFQKNYGDDNIIENITFSIIEEFERRLYEDYILEEE